MTNYILFIIFSASPLWFYKYMYFVSRPPPPTLFDLPYQQQTMGAVILADQEYEFLYFC